MLSGNEAACRRVFCFKSIAMKIFRFIFIPLVLTVIVLMAVSIQSCKPDDDPEPCDTCIVAYKPNIYLYPVQKMPIQVELVFPQGGKVIASEPDYGQGWHITATPNGRINGQFDFLFYESKQPDRWQRTRGWVVKQKEIERFFSENMHQHGFSDKETADFTDYWVKRLDVFPYYVVYPQDKNTIDALIQLKISPRPDKILRLFYLIEGRTEQPAQQPEAPVIDAFERTGFVVAEWGVLMQ